MHYTAHTAYAFDSVEHIMRDVNYGWLLRYAHANGASMFFIVVYIHVFKALYYGSYKRPRELLWMLGVVIILLMMATAFMGYVLPWGQMSFWGATVITNLFSAVPFVGESIVTWLWGGFSVDNPTLNRFYALHFVLPFVIFAVVFLHLLALHQFGSNNPVGIDIATKDKIPFHPYYTIKDLFGLAVFLIFYAAFVFYAPNYLGHPDNYIPANPLSTPAHIVPEWYFLPFYAILRSTVYEQLFAPLAFLDWFGISAKLAGVILMFASIGVLFFLPWLDTSKVRSANYRPIYFWLFWVFLIDCAVLTWAGGQVPTPGVVWIGQIATLYYFVHFLVLFPLLGKFERPRPLPSSIDRPVLGQSGELSAQPAE
jgi:ubiquinol-cytochrome c reductase cytochrome b/c1 subunit